MPKAGRSRLRAKRRKKAPTSDVPLGSASWIGRDHKPFEAWIDAWNEGLSYEDGQFIPSGPAPRKHHQGRMLNSIALFATAAGSFTGTYPLGSAIVAAHSDVHSEQTKTRVVPEDKRQEGSVNGTR